MFINYLLLMLIIIIHASAHPRSNMWNYYNKHYGNADADADADDDHDHDDDDDHVVDMSSENNVENVVVSPKCAMIYIPEHKINEQEYDMILFVSTEGQNNIPSVDFGSNVAVPGEISEGRIISFNNHNKTYPISLQLDTDHVCDSKYSGSELRVVNVNDIGYIYRPVSLTHNNYNDFTQEMLLNLARELVVTTSYRLKKRSKYLGVCLSGDNTNFAEYRCYGLRDNSKLAYLPYDSRLFSSTTRMTLIIREDETFWIRRGRKYYVTENNRDSIVDSTYAHYFIMNNVDALGKIFYVSDNVYEEIKDLRGDSVERIVGNYREI